MAKLPRVDRLSMDEVSSTDEIRLRAKLGGLPVRGYAKGGDAENVEFVGIAV